MIENIHPGTFSLITVTELCPKSNVAAVYQYMTTLNKCLDKSNEKYTKNYTLIGFIYRKGCRKVLFLNV